MTKKIWNLNAIKEPDKNGIYEVRFAKKGELLSCPLTTFAEFKDGKWILKPSTMFADYEVISWR